MAMKCLHGRIIQEIDKGRYDVCQPPNRECLSRFGWHTGEILPSRLI
jgi:hypothetical protein